MKSFRLAAIGHWPEPVYWLDESVQVDQKVWILQEKQQRSFALPTGRFRSHSALVAAQCWLCYRRRHEGNKTEIRQICFDIISNSRARTRQSTPWSISWLTKEAALPDMPIIPWLRHFFEKASFISMFPSRTTITSSCLRSKDSWWTEFWEIILKRCSTKSLYRSTRTRRWRSWPAFLRLTEIWFAMRCRCIVG